MTTYPPFAPPHPGEADLGQLLSRGEIKRTGHLFSDCPALALADLETKASKAKACEPCKARFAQVGATGRQHQKQFDAAWYAQAAAVSTQEAPVPASQPAYLSAAQANEDEMWDAAVPHIDVYEAVIDTPPPARREHRSNKFAGSCVHCKGWVDAGAGAIGKNAIGKWVVAHIDTCPAPAPRAAAAAPATAAVEPGMYWDADGDPVKVQRSRTSGNLYVKTVDGEYVGGGRHLQGLVRMTLDEAKAYGRRTGQCCCCGAELTDPNSIAAGIGPICASRF